MNIFASTKLGTTPKGQSELVQLAIEQAELNAEEDPIIIEDECVERYIQCATQALPYFSVNFCTFVYVLTGKFWINKFWLFFFYFFFCRHKLNPRHL